MSKSYHSFEAWREDLGLNDEVQRKTRKASSVSSSKGKSSKKKGKSKGKPANTSKKKGPAYTLPKKKREENKREYEARKPVKLEYVMQCPRHGVHMDKGKMVILSTPNDGNVTIPLFYCYDCNQYYFSTDEFPVGSFFNYHKKKAKNVNMPIYKRVNEELILVFERQKKKVPEKTAKKKIERKVLGKKTEEDENKIEQARQQALIHEKRAREVEKRFDPQTDTLYIHKGMIKCLQDKHDVISVTLKVPAEDPNVLGKVNANYCFECNKFFLSLDEYEVYQKRNQIMIVKFHFLDGTTYDSTELQWADKSPLMLAGYSVSATKGYSDEKRKRILKSIIDRGIVSKTDIIRYINWFINRNENRENLDEAIGKWTRDLEFVRNYKMEQQRGKKIKKIKQHR